MEKPEDLFEFTEILLSVMTFLEILKKAGYTKKQATVIIRVAGFVMDELAAGRDIKNQEFVDTVTQLVERELEC